jgi:hypothetical protein
MNKVEVENLSMKKVTFTTTDGQRISIHPAIIRSVSRNGIEPATVTCVNGTEYLISDTAAEILIEELFSD